MFNSFHPYARPANGITSPHTAWLVPSTRRTGILRSRAEAGEGGPVSIIFDGSR